MGQRDYSNTFISTIDMCSLNGKTWQDIDSLVIVDQTNGLIDNIIHLIDFLADQWKKKVEALRAAIIEAEEDVSDIIDHLEHLSNLPMTVADEIDDTQKLLGWDLVNKYGSKTMQVQAGWFCTENLEDSLEKANLLLNKLANSILFLRCKANAINKAYLETINTEHVKN